MGAASFSGTLAFFYNLEAFLAHIDYRRAHGRGRFHAASTDARHRGGAAPRGRRDGAPLRIHRGGCLARAKFDGHRGRVDLLRPRPPTCTWMEPRERPTGLHRRAIEYREGQGIRQSTIGYQSTSGHRAVVQRRTVFIATLGRREEGACSRIATSQSDSQSESHRCGHPIEEGLLYMWVVRPPAS